MSDIKNLDNGPVRPPESKIRKPVKPIRPPITQKFRHALNHLAGTPPRDALSELARGTTDKSVAIESPRLHETPAQHFEIKPVASEQEISEKIAEQIVPSNRQQSDADLDLARQALVNRPQLGGARLKDVLVGLPSKTAFAWIDTSAIVGISHETPEGWGHEIQARKGRAVSVAKDIINHNTNPEAIERIFHPAKPSERIQATVIPGPKGPMIYVDDGTHRVTGCMTAGLKEIPAEIKVLTYPLEQFSQSETEVKDWEDKIALGLITGEIQNHVFPTGRKAKKLVVQSEVVPWIRTQSQADLMRISRVYERMYPGALDNLAIPRDALVDPVANNYFMARRFQEWIDLPKVEPITIQT